MDDFLTSRQVQDVLKVDRITIYRMINDGRLKGSKIGQQWRFPRADVENLLNGFKVGDEVSNNNDENGLPVHCLQTIQDLFAAVSQYSAVLINLQGNPITEMSNAREYCHLICSHETARDACRASQYKFVQQARSGEKRFTCHTGLNYAGTLVSLANEPIGLFLVGGFKRQGIYSENEEAPYEQVARYTRIPGQIIQAAYEAIPSLSFEQEEKIDAWTTAAAQAFESILQERSAFARRLKKIADLTQIP